MSQHKKLTEAWEKQSRLFELNDVIKWVEPKKADETLPEFLRRIEGLPFKKLEDVYQRTSFTNTAKHWDREHVGREEEILTRFIRNLYTVAWAAAISDSKEMTVANRELDKLRPELEELEKERRRRLAAIFKIDDMEEKSEKREELYSWVSDHPAMKHRNRVLEFKNKIESKLRDTWTIKVDKLLSPATDHHKKSLHSLKDNWDEMTGKFGPNVKDADVIKPEEEY